jgi:hypothetical protein
MDRVWIGLMSERFRLLFRGEVLEGQHKAVVKKRLAKLLGIEDARAERLFAGKPVVIKKDVDQATAARYQAEFKSAGARLRVVGGTSPAAAASPAPTPAPAREQVQAQEPESPGSDPTVAEPGAMLSDGGGAPPPPPPDTSHLSVAETGSDLLEDVHRAPEVVLELDPDWDLAAPGTDLGQISADVVDVDIEVNFTVAPPGADLDEREKSLPPEPPDTTHINLEGTEDP